MARLSADIPLVHPDCTLTNATFGAFTEIGRGSRITHTHMDDFSYCDRYADIANARIGKFANIASYIRIGPTDHPMDQPSLHHFLYRSDDYWDGIVRDEAFFEHRHSRVATIGHDTWIGHGAVIRPEVTIGHGAVIASSAVVTKDVGPYQIVTGIPATPLRARFPSGIADRLIELAWWDWDHNVIRDRIHDFRHLPIEAFLETYEGAPTTGV